MFRLPLLGLAEIAWRWTFGLGAVVALLFALREYLDTLPLTAAEMLLLRTRQPILILQALSRIFQGSAPRVAFAVVVLTLALSLAWIVLASLGRAATLKTLAEHFGVASGRGRLTSLLALNSLRVAVFLTAMAGIAGAFLVARAASSPDDPSPGIVLLVFWTLTLALGLVWSWLNWYLSLAAIFVVSDGASAFAALVSAVGLCRYRASSLLAAVTWFGVAHTVMFVIASSLAALPLGFAGILPVGVVLGGVLLVTLLYFAAVDFLYVGRLASYLSLVLPPTEN